MRKYYSWTIVLILSLLSSSVFSADKNNQSATSVNAMAVAMRDNLSTTVGDLTSEQSEKVLANALVFMNMIVNSKNTTDMEQRITVRQTAYETYKTALDTILSEEQSVRLSAAEQQKQETAISRNSNREDK